VNGSTETVDVRLYREGKVSRTSEPVIREKPVEIFLNNRQIATIACTGIHLEELAVGFLRSIGIIRVPEDIQKTTLSPGGRRVHVLTTDKTLAAFDPSDPFLPSSGGLKIKESGKEKVPLSADISLPAKKIIDFMEELLTSSELHRMTHGTHCSALADTERIIVSRDDIGRHNTIDMLGGYTLLRGIDCSDKIIVKTGRVSSEIAQKAWVLGIPIMISHSAPTSAAIDILREAGITLIGNVRGRTFKVYSSGRRVQY
jgi:FdhD protein